MNQRIFQIGEDVRRTRLAGTEHLPAMIYDSRPATRAAAIDTNRKLPHRASGCRLFPIFHIIPKKYHLPIGKASIFACLHLIELPR